MTTVNVAINSMDRVRGLYDVLQDCDYEVDAVSGRYVVDAKSIMAIFSLNLGNPLQLVIHNNEEDDISDLMAKLQSYLV